MDGFGRTTEFFYGVILCGPKNCAKVKHCDLELAVVSWGRKGGLMST